MVSQGAVGVSDKPIWSTEWETVSTGELSNLDAASLRNQLAYVMEKSSFYQRKYSTAGLAPRQAVAENWNEIPCLEKEELLADQNANPPYGTNLCADMRAVTRIHRTSGTTARPLFLALTRRDIAAIVECGARCFWASGLRPDDVVFHCLNYCLWIGGYTDHQSMEKTGAAVVPHGAGNSSALINTMLHLKPTAIHCTPSYLSQLEHLLREEFNMSPSDLGLRKGFFGGEGGLENPAFRQKMETLWGFRAMNANYGVSDALSMFGGECDERDGMHFMGQGKLYVEIIDRESLHVLPVEKGVIGELVLTNLEKEAQPLIRFRSHDLIEIVDHNPCRCGRSSFRFRVIGRSDDLIVVKGINIFPSSIAEILSEFLDLTTGEYQIVIDSPPPISKLAVKIEARDAVEQTTYAGIQERLREKIWQTLQLHFEIQIVSEGSLTKTEGKVKRVLRTYSAKDS